MVGDIIARYSLEVESPRQSPEQGKSLLDRRAQRQYVMRFDVLDVGKDERLELHGEVAKSGIQIDHLAAATRGWVVTSALRRVVVKKVSSDEATSSLKK